MWKLVKFDNQTIVVARKHGPFTQEMTFVNAPYIWDFLDLNTEDKNKLLTMITLGRAVEIGCQCIADGALKELGIDQYGSENFSE